MLKNLFHSLLIVVMTYENFDLSASISTPLCEIEAVIFD
jgi:hypothetical protein